jgi:hypothetical protein
MNRVIHPPLNKEAKKAKKLTHNVLKCLGERAPLGAAFLIYTEMNRFEFSGRQRRKRKDYIGSDER